LVGTKPRESAEPLLLQYSQPACLEVGQGFVLPVGFYRSVKYALSMYCSFFMVYFIIEGSRGEGNGVLGEGRFIAVSFIAQEGRGQVRFLALFFE